MDVLQAQDNNGKEGTSGSTIITNERYDAVEEVVKVEVKQSEECGSRDRWIVLIPRFKTLLSQEFFEIDSNCCGRNKPRVPFGLEF